MAERLPAGSLFVLYFASDLKLLTEPVLERPVAAAPLSFVPVLVGKLCLLVWSLFKLVVFVML